MNEESGKRAVRRGHTGSSGVAARNGGGLVSGQAEGERGLLRVVLGSGSSMSWLVKQARLRNMARGKRQNGNVGSTG